MSDLRGAATWGLAIDVVSSNPDGALGDVRRMLPNALVVNSVYDMVQKIRSQLGRQARIRRLRIFSHGAPNFVVIGHIQYPRALQLGNIDILDWDRVMTSRRGRIINEGTLAGIRGRFATGGWVELHGCSIAGQQGNELLRGLADVFGVPVLAGSGLQYPGGGLEEPVYVGRPGTQQVELVPTRIQPRGKGSKAPARGSRPPLTADRTKNASHQQIARPIGAQGRAPQALAGRSRPSSVSGPTMNVPHQQIARLIGAQGRAPQALAGRSRPSSAVGHTNIVIQGHSAGTMASRVRVAHASSNIRGGH